MFATNPLWIISSVYSPKVKGKKHRSSITSTYILERSDEWFTKNMERNGN